MIISDIAAASKIMVGTQQATAMYIGATKAWSASRLPNGYTELPYISSTASGGQYIDLGCKLLENTDDIRFDMKFNFKGHGKTGIQQSTLICGQPEVSPWPGFTLRITANDPSSVTVPFGLEFNFKWDFEGINYASGSNKFKYIRYEGIDVPANQPVAIVPDSKKRVPSVTHALNEIVEDTVYITSIPSTQINNANLTLFCAMNSSNQPFRFAEADFYYLKITKGTTVVRELIPAQRNSDNEVGLYDIQNDVFYYSLGDSPFVAGSAS